mmetsp:Transcript_34533/g.83532  ORF Transcript_34533/g.83532 Transcript_34533/m.83532 type:complete len:345 (-) Transcript_34533:276-1310(-)
MGKRSSGEKRKQRGTGKGKESKDSQRGKKLKRQSSKPETYDLSAIEPAKSKLKIVSWNVNGLRSLLEKHKTEVTEYFTRENADIICMQETKVNEDATDEVEKDICSIASGYKFYWSCSSVKKGYAGTLIMSKVKPINVQTDDVLGMGDKEGRAILAEYKNVIVVNTYVPNSGLKLDRLDYRTTNWDPRLREKIVSLKETKPVIWCGDLNVAHGDIDVADWKKKRNKVPGFCDSERENFGRIVGGDGREITDEMRQKRTASIGRPGGDGSGFLDVWNHLNPEKVGYTFWSYRFNARGKNNGWRLDYFVVSEEFMQQVENLLIREEFWGPSDHVPVALLLKKGNTS